MSKRKNKNNDQTYPNKRTKLDEHNQDNGYETDSESCNDTSNVAIKEKKGYKKRLLIGENGYSYTKALIKKHEISHPELGSAIVATEISTAVDKDRIDDIKQNKEYLENHCVEIIEGQNASIENLVKKYKEKQRFPRIHFNLPHDGRSYENWGGSAPVNELFEKVKDLQEIGDRIHMALPKKHVEDQLDIYSLNYPYTPTNFYGIFESSTHNGYKLIDKRKFGRIRYPDYQHAKTKNGYPAAVAETAREYIFEKISKTRLTRDNDGGFDYKFLVPKKIFGYTNYLQASHAGGEMSSNILDALDKAGAELTVLLAYLEYDVKDKQIDAGWSHPCILQALAHIQGINLYIWQKDHDSLIPHLSYPEYIIEGANSTIDLLFVNGNHFERLDPTNSKDPVENMPTKKLTL